MTTYQMTPVADGISIELSGIGDGQEQLLGAFSDCQAGHCTCPTTEYEKVEAMDLDSAEDKITIRLRAKPGQGFDEHQIAACLEHTVAKANSTGD